MRGYAWETWKLSHAYRRIGSGTTPTSSDARYYTDSDGTPWVTTAELRENYISSTQQNVTEEALADFPALRVYSPGSVLIAMYGATIGRLGMIEVAATCNQACCVFDTSDRFDNRFLFYWLWHRRDELIAQSVGGGQPNLSQQDFRQERAFCPPLDTQLQIVRFLDEKTTRIDELIEKKRELLDRLAEKRQALVAHAATKGLNPDAPMQPSGIDWLGDIPAHWATGNIRRFATMKTGHTPSRSRTEYWDNCTIPWFGLTDVWQLRDGRWYMEETAEKISEIGLANSAAELLPTGTVVFSRTASVGYSGIMPQPMATTQDFWNWVCGPKLTPRYLLLLFRSMTQKFAESTSGSTHKTIYQGIAAGLQICVAPISEQKAIADFVFERSAEIDAVAEKVRSSIGYLSEYRAALVTAAVTGQIAELR